MTSGQGGPYGEPQGQPGGDPGQGRPQGWNAPPPPQGWNAPPPPQGWNAPPAPQYGQHGYGPAPSAPTGYGAPTPVERPTTVRAGIGALVASLILGVISAVVSLADIQSIIDDTLATAAADDTALTEDTVRAGIVVGAVVGLIIWGLYVLFLWFAWKGRNWARIVLWVLGGISLTFGLLGLAAGGSAQSGFLTSLGWFQLLLTAAGMVLLALKPSNEWYRYRSWQRAAGQG